MLRILRIIIGKLLTIFDVQQHPKIGNDVFNITINANVTNNYKKARRRKRHHHSNVGDVKLYAGNEPPKGWFICDGQLLIITEYPDLFAVIGITYGGDGVTTFALPDMRGRTAVGVGKGEGLTHREIGEVFGAETTTLRDDSMEIQGSLWQPKDPGFRGMGDFQGNIRDMQSTTISIQSPSVAMNYIIRWKCN